MPKKKLTVRTIDALPRPETGQIDYWDEGLPGFGIRISHGGTRTWILMYRYGGSKYRLKLGRYPQTPLARAREKALAALRDLDDDKNPAVTRDENRKAITFEKLAAEYIEKHAKVKKRSWRKDQAAIDRDLNPTLGKMRAKDIRRRDILDVIEAIRARGAPVQSNRVHEIARRIFSWAINTDRLPEGHYNPASSVEREREQSRRRVLSADEIKTLWAALDDEPSWVAALFRLRLLTAQRPGEVLRMRLQDITREPTGYYWTLPAEFSKTNEEHRTPLPPQAVAELKRYLGTDEIEGEGWVFCNPATGERYFGDWKPMGRIREATKLDFRPHDLRRTAATWLSSEAIGTPDATVRRVLNHADRSQLGTYNRYTYDKEKREALAAWAGLVDRFVAGDKAEVIPMEGT